MVENQHILKVLRSAIHKLLYPFLVDITSTCVSIKNSIRFGSHPKTVASKKKMFSVIYIYKTINKKWM
jgi:hypothetical protein